MPQTAARLTGARAQPELQGGAPQHATHAETQISAGRRRRGTQAVLSAEAPQRAEREGSSLGDKTRDAVSGLAVL